MRSMLFYAISFLVGMLTGFALVCAVAMYADGSYVHVNARGTVLDEDGRLVTEACVVLSNDRSNRIGGHYVSGRGISISFLSMDNSYHSSGEYFISLISSRRSNTECMLYVYAPGYNIYSTELPPQDSNLENHIVNIVLEKQ